MTPSSRHRKRAALAKKSHRTSPRLPSRAGQATQLMQTRVS